MSDDPFDLDAVLAKYTKKPSEVSRPELALLYGPPGGGKTYVAATYSQVPGVKRVLILDTEGSTAGTLTDFDDDVVSIIDCRRDTKTESFQFLDTILKKFYDADNKHSYDAVIIDTFDIAQDWATVYFTENTPKAKNGEVDGFAVWRAVKDWSVDIAQQLKRISAMGIIVVHEREEKTKDGTLITKLNLVGSAKDVLPGVPDIVGYVYRVLEDDGSEVTYGEFASQGDKVTKNRYHFPPNVTNPNFPGLLAFIDKQQEAKK